MPRERSPNKDKALEIYKKHKGNITNREIANMLGEDEKKVAVWKQRDKWNDVSGNVVQQKKESCTTKLKTNKNTNNKEPKLQEVEEIISNSELTDKQRLFCIYYIKYFNATKAYKKAYGCDYSTAMVNGCNLLRNTKVQGEIQKLKTYKLNRAMLSEEDIFQKYIDIAFSDITDYLEFKQEKVEVMGAF